jgi:hypothetical protein
VATGGGVHRPAIEDVFVLVEETQQVPVLLDGVVEVGDTDVDVAAGAGCGAAAVAADDVDRLAERLSAAGLARSRSGLRHTEP